MMSPPFRGSSPYPCGSLTYRELFISVSVYMQGGGVVNPCGENPCKKWIIQWSKATICSASAWLVTPHQTRPSEQRRVLFPSHS